MLALPVESLEMWNREELIDLLDYSYNQGYEDQTETKAKSWQELYRRVWLALYGYPM